MHHASPPALCVTPAMRQLVELALEEDLGRGDVTTEAIAVAAPAVGTVIGRAPLVCCGLPVVEELLARAGLALRCERLAAEGDALVAGDPLCRVVGAADAILRVERTALNFLMRLCGVATQARRFVDAVAGTGARVVDTRKTTPGWRALEKYAVRVGGAGNHRFDLGSGILIKDNHIAACGSVGEAVRRARAVAPHPLRVEVEVESLAQLDEALAAGAEVLLLDNMTPERVGEAAARVAGRALIEVSGGVTLQTVRAFAEAGAQLVSAGALTHSAPAADLSLELELVG
jgi:nicotinate-nucleotide pyrophosphorylase (carboxylating)